MRAAIVGASAGLGRALAEGLAQLRFDLFLVASDERDLQAMSSHLRLLHRINVEYLASRVSADSDWAQQVRSAAERGGAVDVLMFPVGASRSDDRGDLADRQTLDLIGTNLVGVIHLAGAMLPAMLSRDTGCIVGFGSVAGTRGRAQNVVYSAAKRGLQSYFESLRHLTNGTGVRAHFVILGYVDTQQTFGKMLPLPVASPEMVAKSVMAMLGRESAVVHLPRFWALLVLAIRAAPFFLFKKIKA